MGISATIMSNIPSPKFSISPKAAPLRLSAGDLISRAAYGVKYRELNKTQTFLNSSTPLSMRQSALDTLRSEANRSVAIERTISSQQIQQVQTPDTAQSNIRDVDSTQSAPSSRQLLAQQASASMYAVNAQQQPQQPVLSLLA